MTDLILSQPATSAVAELENDLPQGVLLSGTDGVGLLTIAKHIAKNSLVRVVSPDYLTKASSSKQIGVDNIRDLYQQTRSKTTGLQVLLIDDADLMTVSAQNAFLKLLEEPATNIHFILTSHHPEQLLATVLSRLRHIHIPAPRSNQTNDMIAALDTSLQGKITFVAAGLPAEISRLSADTDYFKQMVELTSKAKELLEAEPYQRIKLINKMPPQREVALQIIERMIYLLSRKPTKSSVGLIGQLVEVHNRTSGGASVKLQLLSVMI